MSVNGYEYRVEIASDCQWIRTSNIIIITTHVHCIYFTDAIIPIFEHVR